MATKVAVAGATGNLGPSIVNALLAANYPVTILTRQGSTSSSKLPKNDNITVKEVDFTSVTSLTPALQGVKVVVSVLAGAATGAQNTLIDASIAAGVTRFLPSEFGSNTSNPKAAALPVFKGKVDTQKYLAEKAKENPSFSYTLINNGAFLDWGLKAGFVLNPAKHTANVFNGGDVKFSATTLPSIGQAIVGVIQHLDETKNRAVYIQDALLTQNQLIQYAKDIDGKEWTITHKDTAKIYAEAIAIIQKGPSEQFGPALGSLISSALYDPSYGGDYSAHLDNKLLGLKGLSDEEVKKLVADTLSAAPSS